VKDGIQPDLDVQESGYIVVDKRESGIVSQMCNVLQGTCHQIVDAHYFKPVPPKPVAQV
jgi:hypothetical protein